MQNYSDQDYYWAKAEFQDYVAHRRHIDSYKRGIADDEFFHERYRDEALKELYEEYKQEWCETRGYILAEIDETVGINGECYVCFDEWYSNEYKENGGVL